MTNERLATELEKNLSQEAIDGLLLLHQKGLAELQESRDIWRAVAVVLIAVQSLSIYIVVGRSLWR